MMEELSLGKLLVLVVVFSAIIEIIVPLVLASFSCWLEFTFRKPTDTFEFGSWWVHKYHFIWGVYKGADPGDWFIGLAHTTFLFGVLLFGYYFTGGLILTTVILGFILAVIFCPRFILDIIRTLKYDHNTGDSERISKMEKELQILKEKQR